MVNKVSLPKVPRTPSHSSPPLGLNPPPSKMGLGQFWAPGIPREIWLGGGPLTPPPPRDASEGKGPQRRPQKQLYQQLEAVAKAVGGGYCRLEMPLKLALAVSWTVAGHRPGALKVGTSPPSDASPPPLCGYAHPPIHTSATALGGVCPARQLRGCPVFEVRLSLAS